MQLKEIMTSPVLVCQRHDTLEQAARLMWDHDCGALPVINDVGILDGIITDRDICMAAYTRERALSGILVADAMTSKVFTCRPQDSLDTAEGVMSARRVRRIPIVDAQNHPVGLLSLDDVACACNGAASNGSHKMARQLTATLAKICEPSLAGA